MTAPHLAAQARSISGGAHFHPGPQPGTPLPLPLPRGKGLRAPANTLDQIQPAPGATLNAGAPTYLKNWHSSYEERGKQRGSGPDSRMHGRTPHSDPAPENGMDHGRHPGPRVSI